MAKPNPEQLPLMPVADHHRENGRRLLALPVGDRAARDAHLYCWTTDAHLHLALHCVERWGFRFVQGLIWGKRTSRSGSHRYGGGHYFRHVHELILFAVRGQAPAARHDLISRFDAVNSGHSRKPDALRCIVLVTMPADAFWVTSWPFAQYVKHRWPGAWVCSAFRRERVDGPSASDMIRAAVAATRWKWPDVPPLGMVTFLDRRHVRPVMRRGVPTYGRTWLLAGFEPDGETQGGLLAFRLPPDAMPVPELPRGAHSEKPPDLHRALERLCRGPRLELFARAARPGWTAWGNEAPGTTKEG